MLNNKRSLFKDSNTSTFTTQEKLQKNQKCGSSIISQESLLIESGRCDRPFLLHALAYHQQNLSIFPAGGENGKKPAIKTWKPYQESMASLEQMENWQNSHADSNIAMITGQVSGIVVVDCDDKDFPLSDLFEQFGETPLVVKTPSGGLHLYYRYNGERNAKIANPKGDIRGEGGYVIVPPSYNPLINVSYSFFRGDLENIASLPYIKENAVEKLSILEDEEKILKSQNCQKLARSLVNKEDGKIAEGARNCSLFLFIKEKARDAGTIDELLAIAVEFNDTTMSPQLPTHDVKRVVNKVWSYKLENKLYNKGKQHIPHDKEMHRKHSRTPYAAYLFVDLKLNVSDKRKFAISPKPYAGILGWSPATMRKAIRTLIGFGDIKQIHVGGKGKNDPHYYSLGYKK
jgi:hypothetical protein